MLDLIGDELNKYAPFHLARADMLRRMREIDAAQTAYKTAYKITQNEVECTYISQQISDLK